MTKHAEIEMARIVTKWRLQKMIEDDFCRRMTMQGILVNYAESSKRVLAKVRRDLDALAICAVKAIRSEENRLHHRAKRTKDRK